MTHLFINSDSLLHKENPVCIVDPVLSGVFYNQLNNLFKPLVTDFSCFYAVKCNPDFEILKVLHAASCNFEVASVNEFNLVCGLDNIDPVNILVTNPILSKKDLQFLIKSRARMFVIDSQGQLERLYQACSEVNVACSSLKIIVRLAVSNEHAAWDLSDKFGLEFSDLPNIFSILKSYDFNFQGFSFHVGSQSQSPKAYFEALEIVTLSATYALSQGFECKIVDIGGGFPIDYNGSSLQEISHSTSLIVSCVVDYIASSLVLGSAQIWAEPGRFIAAPSSHVVAKVIAKASRNGKTWVYSTVGTYNGPSEPRDFKDSLYFPVSYDPVKFKNSDLSLCVLTGPTCDSSDVYSLSCELPVSIDSEDVIQFPLTGAYSSALWTSFNGFDPPEVIYFPNLLTSFYV